MTWKVKLRQHQSCWILLNQAVLCTGCTNWPTIHVEQIRGRSSIVCSQLEHFNSFTNNQEKKHRGQEWNGLQCNDYIVLKGRRTETERRQKYIKPKKTIYWVLVRKFQQHTGTPWRDLENDAAFLPSPPFLFFVLFPPTPPKIPKSQPGFTLPQSMIELVFFFNLSIMQKNARAKLLCKKLFFLGMNVIILKAFWESHPAAERRKTRQPKGSE